MTHPRKMTCPKEPPPLKGVYALLHVDGETKIAFVGHCKNLRHRRAVWEYNFRCREGNAAHIMPAKMFPEIGAEHWKFVFWEQNVTEDDVRRVLREKGYELIPKTSRTQVILTHQGVTGTLTALSQHFGVPYNRAYYLLRKGRPLDEVFSGT